MTDSPGEFSTTCDWCRIEVISFAQPPAMVEVTTNAWERRTARVCLDCYAELLALIAKRGGRLEPADGGDT